MKNPNLNFNFAGPGRQPGGGARPADFDVMRKS